MIYALIDCNNFFVSCERAFQPNLQKRPVLVLSGNDGCAVSRSQEVKKLGLPMGAPYFKNIDLIRKNRITVFSSNFELYSDMSARVMALLKNFTDEVEIYSIDEAFLRLDNIPDPEAYAREIRKAVWKQTRIPVSIGLATSKTLAKAASHLAKDNPGSNGVFSLLGKDIKTYLKKIPVEEIWGIGRNLKVLLHSHKIFTAAEFAHADSNWIKKNMGVVGLRLANELQSLPCDQYGNYSEDARQSIMRTRSFGRGVFDISELREAVAMHVAQVGEELRQEKQITKNIGVLLRTNRYSDDKKYSATQYVEIETPTQYTPELSKHALRILDMLYKPGFRYWKVGILCSDLLPESSCQQSIFEQRNFDKEKRLMSTQDMLNAKFGSGTLRYAQSGIKRPWQAKREMLSRAFTTDINQLPVVKAG